MHVRACIQGQIMHDVREEPLDNTAPSAVYPGGESSTECIISAHKCTSNRALFVLYNFPLLLSCPQKLKSQWIMENFVFLPSRSRFGLDRDVSRDSWVKSDPKSCMQSLIPISVIHLNPRCNTNSNNKLKCHCKTGFQHIYLHSPDETRCFVYKGHGLIVIEVEVLDPSTCWQWQWVLD